MVILGYISVQNQPRLYFETLSQKYNARFRCWSFWLLQNNIPIFVD